MSFVERAELFPNPHTAASDYIAGLCDVLNTLSSTEIGSAVEILWEAYCSGREVFIIGNGGSAATASHMACDLAKTVLGRPASPQARRFKVSALVDNSALMTAWANDVGFDVVFAEQIRAQARAGDVLVAISASGNSPNIVNALTVARDLGVYTVALLGFDGGAAAPLADCPIVVPSDNYGFIEDAHGIVNHLTVTYFLAAIRAQ